MVKSRKLVVSVMALSLACCVALTSYLLYSPDFPNRILTSLFWKPAENSTYPDTLVVIEMGSNDDFPLMWKSVGSFFEEVAVAGINVVHYRDVTPELIDSLTPSAVVLTGYHQDLSTYNFDEMSGLFRFLTSTSLPTLGICGGHQFIAKAYGRNIVPLGQLELGMIPTQLVGNDELFRGLSNKAVVFYGHILQVDELPPEFDLLAFNSVTAIQAMRHRSKPIYGVQFHPEASDKNFSDGLVVARNFLRIAGVPVRNLESDIPAKSY